MEIKQWCERVFEFWVEKNLKKERGFLFFWVAERQREKSKEERNRARGREKERDRCVLKKF